MMSMYNEVALQKEKKKKIHMIAVGGTGMTALAGLLIRDGHTLTGSDQNLYPPMSELLAELRIPCFQGYRADQIPKDIDFVVIGNAIGKNNPEVLAVQERGLPYFSMPQAVSHFFLEGKEPLVVAGTHGKTTTCALLAWILESAGKDPGLMIGGWIKNFDGNHKLGKGKWFVLEGDEYDTAFFDKGPKFLHYRPRYGILTSVEFDHADIYPSLESVKAAFSLFSQLLPSKGFLMVDPEGKSVREVIRGAKCPVETYGTVGEVDWKAQAIELAGECTRFEVIAHGRSLGFFESPMMGLHNLKNSLAVIGLLSHLGLSADTIRSGLASFSGVKRRQEIVGIKNDIVVMDDFAHHPTAVLETIAAVRGRYTNRRIWAVFEPRSATSRRNIFQEIFVDAFMGADCVVLVNLFAPERISPDLRLRPEKVVEALCNRGKEAYFFPTADAVVTEISPRLRPGDLILVMSSGGFDGIHKKLLETIAKA